MTYTPPKTRLLFICGQNKWRSPTAEALFAGSDSVEAISAGTNNDAETPISGDLIDWADHIYVMERTHRAKLTARFAALGWQAHHFCWALPINIDLWITI